jgi:hypothetical protein
MNKAKIQDAQLNALMTARLNEGMAKSIDFGEAWLKAQVADPNSPIKHVSFNSLVLDVMAGYFLRSYPDTANYFKLFEERVKDMLRARVAPYLVTPQADSGVLQTITALPASA